MLSVSFGFCVQYEMVIDRTMTSPFTDMLKNGFALLDSAANLNDTMKNEVFKLFVEDFIEGVQFMATTPQNTQSLHKKSWPQKHSTIVATRKDSRYSVYKWRRIQTPARRKT